MFHNNCVTKWLNMHNTCPLCRFELPTDNVEYEKIRNERNQQRDFNIRNNPDIRPVDFNHPENININNNIFNNSNLNQNINNNYDNRNVNINAPGEDMFDI